MANPFVHLELSTPDTHAAKSFYSDMFGWTYQESNTSPAGPYALFQTDNGPGGGIYSMEDAPTMWLPYIGVDDLKSATAKAESLGARFVNSGDVPDMGSFTILVDPTGAMFAMWENAKPSE